MARALTSKGVIVKGNGSLSRNGMVRACTFKASGSQASGKKNPPVASCRAHAATSAATAARGAHSRSSLMISARYIGALLHERGQRALRPAGVFDERVFEIQVEHVDRRRFERLGERSLLVVKP